MAITSVGYEGPVTDAEWPVLAWNLVSGYSVGSVNDLRVTPTTGDRTVAISNGVAVGAGVMDTATSLTPIALPSVSSGSRWDLIALRRNWSTDATTVVRVAGTATRAIPSGRESTVGTIDDQPLALVRVAAGSTLIQEVVDLRIFVSDGGAAAADDLVRDYANKLGTEIHINGYEWNRELVSGVPTWKGGPAGHDTGWVEISRNPGFVFSIGQVRRLGGVIFYRIEATRSIGFSNGNNVAVIPAGFRPSRQYYTLSSNGPREFGIDTAGAVNANQDSNGVFGVTLHGSYPI